MSEDKEVSVWWRTVGEAVRGRGPVWIRGEKKADLAIFLKVSGKTLVDGDEHGISAIFYARHEPFVAGDGEEELVCSHDGRWLGEAATRSDRYDCINSLSSDGVYGYI